MGPTATLLGFAGLVPPVLLAVVAIVAARGQDWLRFLPVYALFLYTAAILSFLGGIWWGFAMRRESGQASLAAVAILPSLAAWAVTLMLGVDAARPAVLLIVLGMLVLLTLAVDRHLVRTGEAPGGWMRLRVPLSAGLGGIAIATGLLLLAG